MSKLKFFDKVTDKIKECCPEIKTIQLYNSQIDNDPQEEAVFYPAIYLELSTISWQAKNLGIQQGDITLTVHVVTENYKTDDRQFLNIVDKVYECLNQYQECFFTPLTRIEERQDTDHDQLTSWEIDFITSMYDSQDNIKKEMIMTTIDPKTGLVVNVDLDIDDDVIRTGDGNFD